jgi:hypothetical protein
MKKVRILSVTFDNEIKPYEIEAFRGSVIHKAGLEHDIFHNHTSDGKTINRYPLIQYKQIKNKPCIFCIEQGVDEIHHFFTNKDWTVHISGRKLDLKIDRLDLKSFTMQVWNKTFDYTITDWIALNRENYRKYKELEEEEHKKALLRSVLIGNIISMAKSIKWDVDKTIELTISNILRIKPVNFKNNKLIAFDVQFRCNVFLPVFIGLGKGASHGMGVIRNSNISF